MLNYQEYEIAIFNWLMAKHKSNSEFTFTVRQNAAKGAETDYFIGTANSNYFSTTFWTLPVGYPGSSGDCINLIFQLSQNGYSYYFELNQTQAPHDSQNQSALNLLKSLKEPLEKVFIFRRPVQENNKIYIIQIAAPEKIYGNLEFMLKDIDTQLTQVIALIDIEIEREKQSNPEFRANRVTQKEFDTLLDRLYKRIEKHDFPLNIILNIFDGKVIEIYMNVLKRLIRDLDVGVGSEKIYFNYEKRKLIFGIGQRYVFNISADGYFTLISKNEPTHYEKEFKLEPKAYLSELDVTEDIDLHYDELLLAAQEVLAVTNKSELYKHDKKDLRALVFGNSYEVEVIKEVITYPLNQILYGPPGTGKTYNTINKALEILGVETSGLSRTEIKDLYLQKVNEGQISFITFHQSLGYEDFIEGIKPQTSKVEGGHISYEVESGVFKRICDTARIIPELKKQSKSIFNKARFYKVSIGGKLRPEIHDWCLANGCIALGYGNDKNFDAFSNIESWSEYRDLFKNTYPELVEESRYHIQAMYTFQRMAIGDIVVISKGNHVIDAIGKISGEYYWDDQNPTAYCQFRKVEWIAVNINMEPSVFFSKNISQQTIYEFYDADVKKDAFISLFDSRPNEQKNFVLIIDEINRGNVSQVFGELITLLEEDKRAGRPEALEVILPYSKERFSVPDNVHIIGTMNTADRSVEALDTALRRRFSFVEMLPKPELLSPYQLLVHFYARYEHISWGDWINKFDKKATGFYEFIGLAGVTVGDKKEEDIYDILMESNDWPDFENKLTTIGCHLMPPVNLAYFLEVLNKRIEVLKDGNHQIGHAYFINVESFDDLMNVFRDKIIPLLQEYFYGDTEKIQLVLGKGFVRKESAKGFSFAFHESDLDGEYDDRECYYIINESLNDVSLFKEALISAKLGY